MAAAESPWIETAFPLLLRSLSTASPASSSATSPSFGGSPSDRSARRRNSASPLLSRKPSSTDSASTVDSASPTKRTGSRRQRSISKSLPVSRSESTVALSTVNTSFAAPPPASPRQRLSVASLLAHAHAHLEQSAGGSRIRPLSPSASSPLFPSPSSAFAPPPTEEETAAIKAMLSNRASRNTPHAAPGSNQISSSGSSTPAMDDKENCDISRSSSTSSMKRLQSSNGSTEGQATAKARRRSSATHPLSPANAPRRSRPNSMLGTSSEPAGQVLASHLQTPGSSESFAHSSDLTPPSTAAAAASSAGANNGADSSLDRASSSTAKPARPSATSDNSPYVSSNRFDELTDFRSFSLPQRHLVLSNSRRGSDYSGGSSNEPASLADSPAFGEVSLPSPSMSDAEAIRRREQSIQDAFNRKRSSTVTPRNADHAKGGRTHSRHQSSHANSAHLDTGEAKHPTSGAASDQAEDSEASDSTFRPRREIYKHLSTAKSSSTLRPVHAGGWYDPENTSDSSANATVTEYRPVIIRDFAFPASDPRYKGQPPPPDPINIPGEATSSQRNPWGSSAVLSSSSSSSLSSSFTPPPFGSFGFGHAYHKPQNAQSTGGQRDFYNWATWSGSDAGGPTTPAGSGNDARRASGQNEGSGASSSRYHWNFTTEQVGTGSSDSPFPASMSEASMSGRDFTGTTTVPSALLDSALCIDDFDDSDDDPSDDRHYYYSEPIGSEQATPGSVDLTSAYPDTPTRLINAEIPDTVPVGGLLCQAAYAFRAEAPQEMSLQVDDVIRVWEKLCDGWVVGGKVGTDRRGNEFEIESGLIPSNYLLQVQDPSHSTADLPAPEVTAEPSSYESNSQQSVGVQA